MLKTLLPLTALIALGACDRAQDQFRFSMLQEAGAVIDDGQFGAATMNNTLVHSGQRQFSDALANRFSGEVEDTVTFAFNSATLSASARAALDQQARWINTFPEVRFRVYGHTDLVGSARYNKALGMRRARAVVSYLASRGVDRNRVEAVVSEGETQPVVNTTSRNQRNRRTVTEVIGFVQSHPMIMDGKYGAIIYREYVNSAVPPPQQAATNEL